MSITTKKKIELARIQSRHMSVHKVSPLAFTFVLAILLSTFGCRTAAADCNSSPAAGVDWHDCSRKNLIVPGSNFEGANLFSTDLSQTDLSDSNMKSANLEDATLVRSSFAGASIEKAIFAKVEAYRSNFAGVTGDRASFVNAELQRANFGEARLTAVNFEKAELGRANFYKAILTGARFSLANLSRADLTGATIEGPIVFDRAFMFLTRIEGLDLSVAEGLKQSQIDLACGDSATKLPTGLTAPASWPCTSN